MDLDSWPVAGSRHQEIENLAAESARFLDSLDGGPRPAASVAELAELQALRIENTDLRGIVCELRQLIEEESDKPGELAGQQQKEYEVLLEEKSELIRNLHAKINELEQRPPAPPATPKEEELQAVSEELERERCQMQQDRRELEEERRQLVEDERSMSKQMRDMEVQMARERADFARQRNELHRVHEEIRRELENIERNGTLNLRLSQLRQRHQDVASRQGASPGPASTNHSPRTSQPTGEPAPKQKELPKKKDSGFFRGIFGNGKQ